MTVYVRYKQIEQFYRRNRYRMIAYRPINYGTVSTASSSDADNNCATRERIMARNWASLWVGWMAVFGLMILCNFRSGDVSVAHKLGAIICFTFGPLYCWFQTSLSYYMVDVVNSLKMARIRLALTLLMTFCFANCVVTGWMANNLFETSDRVLKETGNSGLYLNSAINEWLLAVTFDLFILTFVGEMYRVSLSEPRCRLHHAIAVREVRPGSRLCRSADDIKKMATIAKPNTNFVNKSCEV